jgi:hypothetical protein
MRKLQQILAVFAALCLSSRCLAGIDDLVIGQYESDSEQAKLYWSAAKNADFSSTMSGHAGISIPKADAQGWDQNVTLKQVEERIKKNAGRKLAVVLLEKNYTGSDKPDENHTALVKLLLKFGFERVVVTQAHSSLTIIEEIHKNSEQPGTGQPATRPVVKPEGGDKPQPEAEVRPR